VPKLVTCPRGHSLEVPTGADGRAVDAQIPCPVCGAAVDFLPRDPPRSPAEAAAPPPRDIRAGDPTHDAETAAPAPSPGAPAIPGYELLEVLGRGGMGVVYKARQTKLDRLVALKMLPPETSNDPAFAERFSREARALARLNHPNIVTVHDFGQSGGESYFVMEFVEGTSLRQRLRAGRVPPGAALDVAVQVCDALGYAHDEHIVHRDIKPENILLDKRGRVKIADFGLVKLLARKGADYTLTGPWQVMGTLKYMAPEQLDNPLAVDHRADIYALGVVLYEMLTGGVPAGRFAAPSQKAPLDPRVDAVVLRALEEHPEQRYQRASEFEASIRSLREAHRSRAPGPGESGTTVEPVGPAGRPPEAVRPQTVLTRFRARLSGAIRWSVALLFSTSGWAIFACLFGAYCAAVGPWRTAAHLPPGDFARGWGYVPGVQTQEGVAAAVMLAALGILLLSTTDFRAPNRAWRPWTLLLTGLGVLVAAYGYCASAKWQDLREGVFLTLGFGIALIAVSVVQFRGRLAQRSGQPRG
jgi:tRNA A-37 threonylcarbamoyl transferase component Bud32